MTEGDIVRAADLDFAAAGGTASLNLQQARRAAERIVVDRALAKADGNISKAAGLLGVSRPTLYNLIEELGIVAQHARDLQPVREKGRKA